MELHEFNSEILSMPKNYEVLNANELANQYRQSFESQRVVQNVPHDERLQY
jgi:hypothetical protein